jgi:hypothetical protein
VLAERWEDNREGLEAALRDGLEIPEGAVSIAVPLDGVLAPHRRANDPTAERQLHRPIVSPDEGMLPGCFRKIAPRSQGIDATALREGRAHQADAGVLAWLARARAVDRVGCGEARLR